MQKSHDLTKKQSLEILLVTVILGLGIFIYDFVNTNSKFDGEIKRKEAGTGEIKENFILEFLDHHEDVEVEVYDRRLSQRAIDKSFKKAINEIEETYLGQNESANNVCFDLDLRTTYVDGLIEVQWRISPYEYISNEGKIKSENIPEDGEVVNLTAQLYYEEAERIYSFSVFVTHKGLDTLEGQMEAINNAVQQENESTRENEFLKLPKEVQGIPLTWKKKMNYRGLQIIFLGIAAAVGLAIGKKRDEKKLKEEYIRQMSRDYPLIVSQLSILMGAGMSFRKALERIVSKYVAGLKKEENPKAGYEEITKTYRKIMDGKGEIQALEELGKTSECKDFRRLSLMLIQNLRKGSGELLDSLEKEEKFAFVQRKQNAIRAGEEASTKLLVPMGGMLFIVIIVLVVPALMQLNV